MPIFTSSKQSNYFSSYIDIKAISTPSNPNSGIGRIFYNSATSKLSFKKSNGTVVDLESGGGGGGGSVNSASNVGSGSGWFKQLNVDDLEFKTLVAGSNQLSIASNVNDLTLDIVEANIKLDDLGAPDDNTDLNATTLKHGLLPKLSGNSTDFLTGQGTWAVPAGGGAGGGTIGGTETQDGDAVTTVFTIAHGLGVDPNAVSVEPSSVDALGDYQVDHDDTNITITYQSAPPSGTGNLVWIWIASVGGSGEANTYSNAGAGGVGITLTKSGINLPFKSINTANSSNITVTDDAGNSEIDIDIGADVMTASSTHTMTNKTFNADGTGNSITNIENADIKAAAGIIYSKLTLTDSIVNADINSAAAIDTSKLADSANFLLTTNTKTVTNKTIDAISNTVLNLTPFSFIIFKISSTYYSYNTNTGAISSNSNPTTVIQAAIDAVNTASGGKIFIKAGTYGTTGSPVVLELKQSVHIEGEGRGNAGTRIIGRWATTGGTTSVGFVSFKNIYLNATNITTGNPVIYLDNAKIVTIEGCKIENNSATDALVKIDASAGGSDYSTTINLIDNYFYGWHYAIHTLGNLNSIHTDRCLFFQSQGGGTRSADTGNAAIFCEQSTGAFYQTLDRCYFEDYYAAISMQEGYINATRIWIDDCEYGVIATSNALSTDRDNYLELNSINCAFFAKLNGTNIQAGGGTVRRWVYESPTKYGNKVSGKTTLTGDSTTTVFNIAHGLWTTPTQWYINPLSGRGMGTRTVTVTSSNIVVTYDFAPSTGSFDVYYEAEIA